MFPRAIALFVAALLASNITYAEINAKVVTDFQKRLMATEYESMQECVHAGFRRLWVIRLSQATQTSTEEALSPASEVESRPPVRQKELEIWTKSHSSGAVANYRFEWCMQHFSIPETKVPSSLMQHCFTESALALDISIARFRDIPASRLKSSLANSHTSLTGEYLSALIDKMYAADGETEEFLLARQLFSSCISSNAHKY